MSGSRVRGREGEGEGEGRFGLVWLSVDLYMRTDDGVKSLGRMGERKAVSVHQGLRAVLFEGWGKVSEVGWV